MGPLQKYGRRKARNVCGGGGLITLTTASLYRSKYTSSCDIFKVKKVHFTLLSTLPSDFTAFESATRHQSYPEA